MSESQKKPVLRIAHQLKDLSFGKLMSVYAESNFENGQEFWPEEPPGRQIALAEQDFYNYLRQVFFRTDGAFYAVLEQDNRYLSALRLEPYRDGLLLEALETAPEQRRRGYAKMLILSVLEQLENQKIYSHVGKRNEASLQTHLRCGFKIVSDCAVYVNGSVNPRSYTLCFDPNQ